MCLAKQNFAGISLKFFSNLDSVSLKQDSDNGFILNYIFITRRKHVVGAHKNRLNETVLMSTHNICLTRRILENNHNFIVTILTCLDLFLIINIALRSW